MKYFTGSRCNHQQREINSNCYLHLHRSTTRSNTSIIGIIMRQTNGTIKILSNISAEDNIVYTIATIQLQSILISNQTGTFTIENINAKI